MQTRILAIVAAAAALSVSAARAEPPAPLSALARMPVKEVTIFKDGHAFVLHAGKMPVDPAGNVVMDYLPTPIMGTFWPYCDDKNAKLTAVVASQRKVLVERTALSVRELLEANVGAAVHITENVLAAGNNPTVLTYPATVLSVPARGSEELEKTSPPGTGLMLPQKGNVVLVKTEQGTRVVNFDNIRDVTFNVEPKRPVAQEEIRNLLTLKLGWDKKPAAEAEVGMMYVQLGLRSIPGYKMVIDGKGNATLKLEASLVNELADLEDVTANLVIGVPTFALKGSPDPISMQAALVRLSQYFEQGQQTRNALSNSMMTQSQTMAAQPQQDGEAGGEVGRRAIDLGPEIAGSGRSEDLFVFTVNHVTLKKGQRMVLPVAEFALKYKDVYKLDVPFAPPPEVWRNFDTSRQAEIARMLAAPKVMHNLRLANDSKFPLTTAPVLILRDQRVLAQSMMTYTPVGADVDLPVTVATDIQMKKTEKESKRTPNAEKWEGDSYLRIDLAGTIKLTNRQGTPADLEVTRAVLGNLLKADNDGKTEMVNSLEDAAAVPGGAGELAAPPWWGWYSWPYWWGHFNGVGRASWKFTLDAGKSIELNYSWYYLWR